MNPTNPSAADDLARVQHHVEALGEHFDSVQIFVTTHEPTLLDGTAAINLGTGNFYTRYGQIHEWLIKQDEFARNKARKDDADPED